MLEFVSTAYTKRQMPFPPTIQRIAVLLRLPLLAVIAFVFSVAVGCGVSQRQTPGPESLAATAQFAHAVSQYSPSGELAPGSANFRLFATIFDRVRDNYVDDVDDATLLTVAAQGMRDAYPDPNNANGDQLVKAAIRGMLGSLDDYSSYLDAGNYTAMRNLTNGQFSGIGIQIAKDDAFIKVISPIDDTPAAKAGLQPGDRVTHADGHSLAGLSLRDVVLQLRGPVDSPVVLTIVRDSAAPFDVRIVRAVVQIKAVQWKLDGAIGQIRIKTFSSRTTEEFLRAVAGIRAQAGAAGVAGYVVDLRNNPGGLFNQAVTVSDALLNDGEIVSTRGRLNRQSFTAVDGDITEGAPIVVLINEGSASASEILAGALRDHHRAQVVGTRSFGKGTVQTVLPLGDGEALKLTTARYYTPSGATVDGGIEPDMTRAQDKDRPGDEQMEAAYAILGVARP
ncbi:MAG: carboxyl-terminal processing protease [Alphaproteobacteria bacterium]